MSPAGAVVIVILFALGVLAGVWKGYDYGRKKGMEEIIGEAERRRANAQSMLVEVYKRGAHDAWVEAGMDPKDLEFKGDADEKSS